MSTVWKNTDKKKDLLSVNDLLLGLGCADNELII